MSFFAKLAQSSGSAVSLAVPFMRTKLQLPGIINISEIRGSITMLRKLSRRLLPRQSGIKSVLESVIRTTGPSSPRGVASVPSVPTVERMQNREASIQVRYIGVMTGVTLSREAGDALS